MALDYMKKTLTLSLSFIIALCLNSFATVQHSDGMVYKGQSGFIEENPIFNELIRRKLFFSSNSTANYSGYTASWTVENTQLYLTGFTGLNKGKQRGLKWLYPKSKGKVLADWYNGKIHLSLGKVKLRVERAYVVTEKLVLFEIKNGKVVSVTVQKYPENVITLNMLFLGK